VGVIMEKIYTVAILGIGARGGDTYGRIINDSAKDRFKIVALCDLRKERLDRFGEKFGVSIENRFTDEKEFFNKKRADLLIIATQDKDHFRHAIKGFETGYNIMVEKPLTDSRDECLKLLKKQKQVNKRRLFATY
jgi:predicted dehydrogenase